MNTFNSAPNLIMTGHTVNINHSLKTFIKAKLRVLKCNSKSSGFIRSYNYLQFLGLRPDPCAGLPITWLKSFGILSLSLISFSALSRASRSNILLSNEVLDILLKPTQTAYSNTSES
jgi:hypothetical protein